MYVIFNLDGSIKEQNINKFIQQGNNDVDNIYVAVVGRVPESYTLEVSCKIPSGDVVDFSSFEEATFEDKNGNEYSGYVFSLNDYVTSLKGIVRVNIVAIENSGKKLVSYPIYLSINEGTSESAMAVISEQEYQNLLGLLSKNTIDRFVYDGETVEEFYEKYNLNSSQIFVLVNRVGTNTFTYFANIKYRSNSWKIWILEPRELGTITLYSSVTVNPDESLISYISEDYEKDVTFDQQIVQDVNDPQTEEALSTVGLVTLFYDKSEIDTNFYSKSQADEKFYDKTQIDESIYTKSQTDEKFYDKDEIDAKLPINATNFVIQ